MLYIVTTEAPDGVAGGPVVRWFIILALIMRMFATHELFQSHSQIVVAGVEFVDA